MDQDKKRQEKELLEFRLYDPEKTFCLETPKRI